jgi:hypothetical protein
MVARNVTRPRNAPSLFRLTARQRGTGTVLAPAGRSSFKETVMAGASIKNKRKYRALKRKGMSKSRAARISNAGKKSKKK